MAEPPLDLDGYVEIVLQTNPTVRRGAGLIKSGAAERLSARLIPDPTLDYSSGRGESRETTGPPNDEYAISLEQTIPWPGTFAAGVRASDRASQTLEAESRQLGQELEAEAREAFGKLLYARTLVEISRVGEADALSLFELISRRADLGEAREADRIKARVEWLRQQRNLRAAERSASAAESIVRALAVEPLPEPLQIAGELPRTFEPMKVSEAEGRLIDSNPRLRAANAEAQRAREVVAGSRQARFPDLGVSLFREKEIDREASGFSLGVKIPLWNANRGEIARSAAAASTAEATLERTRIDLLTELASSLRDVDVASGESAMYLDEILPAAEMGLQIARLSYEEGETSLLDLLDTQRTLRDAQLEAAATRLELALAIARLQLLIGVGAVSGGQAQ